MKDTHVVILGAGPAGLATAYQILKNSRHKVTVLDKAPFVGGAGASFQWNEYTLDYGPHAFHTRGDAPEHLIRELFAEEPDVLINGRKQVHVYLGGKKFKYPLQVGEVLLKFNPFLSIRILTEFLFSSLLHWLISVPIENFENWGRKRFGAKLYQLSFGDYTEKVWKTKANKISEKFASEKIQGFSFINLIVKLLRIGGQVTEPYYQTWIYHKYGSGKLYERMAEKVRQMGGQIFLQSDVKEIHINEENRAVEAIEYMQAGQRLKIPCTQLVNTAPLPDFVRLLGPRVPFVVRNSSSKLRYISLVLVYLEFECEKISENHWFYLLDGNFKFNRVTEQKNLSPFTMKPGHTLLSFELTCRYDDELWRMSDEQLVELAIKDCESVHFVKEHLPKLRRRLVKRVPGVYEIYFKDFDKHAALVLDYVRETEGIHSVGRRGLFLQGDMHQAVQMGLHMGSILSEQEKPNTVKLDDFYRSYVKYVDQY